MKNWLLIVLLWLIAPAHAFPIFNGSFESGLTGWTVDPGTLPTRAVSVTDFTTGGHTITPPDGAYMLRLIAGTIPLIPGSDQLASIVSRDDPTSVIEGEWLTGKFNFVNIQAPPRIDWIGIGIDEIYYKLLGGGDANTQTGWIRFAIQFASSGSFMLDLVCVNDIVSASSSSCAFDDIKIVNSLPTDSVLTPFDPFYLVSEGGDSGGGRFIPQPSNTNTTQVPEPATYALLGLGLLFLVVTTRRKHIFRP